MVQAVAHDVSSRLKHPSICSPVLPVNGLLEQDQSPCGRGSIVVCKKRDCRLVVGPAGCDDVVVVVDGVVDGKAQVVLLRLSEFAIERVSHSGVPRLQRGSEEVPLLL